MQVLADPLLMVIILLNFMALANSRLTAVVHAVGWQGVILGLLPLCMPSAEGLSAQNLIVAAVAILLKGLVIPRMLDRAVASAHEKRELQPLLGFVPALLTLALCTGLVLLFAETLPLAEAHVGLLVVPASLAEVVTGFLLLTTRRLAVSHVVGILVLENGVFTFGLLLLQALPQLVEIGVLLDVFVAVFTMGIVIKHIDRELSTIDTAHLSSLKE